MFWIMWKLRNHKVQDNYKQILQHDGNSLLRVSLSAAHEHLLKGQLLIVWLDASNIVGCGCIEGLHEQVQRAAELAPHCGPQLLAVWLDDLLCSFNCDRWTERGRRNRIFSKKVGTEMKLACSQDFNQHVIDSISVLLKETFTFIFYLCTERT